MKVNAGEDHPGLRWSQELHGQGERVEADVGVKFKQVWTFESLLHPGQWSHQIDSGLRRTNFWNSRRKAGHRSRGGSLKHFSWRQWCVCVCVCVCEYHRRPALSPPAFHLEPDNLHGATTASAVMCSACSGSESWLGLVLKGLLLCTRIVWRVSALKRSRHKL
ncbi:hypothetical protein HJG60_007926 [Phyllostomus discolor]|uniref:Uncharacterized protein n=1 Tax=Phyllostomus discolor TaxID=89673 RepID=A0A834BLA1_9CHIR|nr:hypothetical protein HJG60_007926 [Phyllostomus discolor]